MTGDAADKRPGRDARGAFLAALDGPWVNPFTTSVPAAPELVSRPPRRLLVRRLGLASVLAVPLAVLASTGAGEAGPATGAAPARVDWAALSVVAPHASAAASAPGSPSASASVSAPASVAPLPVPVPSPEVTTASPDDGPGSSADDGTPEGLAPSRPARRPSGHRPAAPGGQRPAGPTGEPARPAGPTGGGGAPMVPLPGGGSAGMCEAARQVGQLPGDLVTLCHSMYGG